MCFDVSKSYIMRSDTGEIVDYISINLSEKTFSLKTADPYLRNSQVDYKWLNDIKLGSKSVELATFTVEYIGKEDPLRFEPPLASII